ncbi:hypothetical protein HNP38_000952 [Chryseobacterium defluvii]|uniref:Uncharacterized protein n=1 Tax=Chryseobacterium defluvii TaxID=160396 RepID=A0A840KDR2_9FLAO|nr:hypothetical protein [Chryseobacterium defluvii]MBB4805680.1 hypothetical protein [Chryseobacterium defluvii]
MFKKTEVLIILFLWLNIIFSFITVPYSNLFLNIGIAGLAIVSVLYKFRPRLSTIILIFLLGIGVFNIASFNNAFQINFAHINIINLLLLSILAYKKRDIISGLKEKWFGTTKEEISERRNSQIDFFRTRFKDLNDDELKRKLQENISDKAKNAIRKILIERKL